MDSTGHFDRHWMKSYFQAWHIHIYLYESNSLIICFYFPTRILPTPSFSLLCFTSFLAVHNGSTPYKFHLHENALLALSLFLPHSLTSCLQGPVTCHIMSHTYMPFLPLFFYASPCVFLIYWYFSILGGTWVALVEGWFRGPFSWWGSRYWVFGDGSWVSWLMTDQSASHGRVWPCIW